MSDKPPFTSSNTSGIPERGNVPWKNEQEWREWCARNGHTPICASLKAGESITREIDHVTADGLIILKPAADERTSPPNENDKSNSNT